MTFNLSEAFQWFVQSKSEVPPTQLCLSRDIFQARLDHFYREGHVAGYTDDELSLLIATCGEIGNNCFDHNLGQWVDLPGAWLQYEILSDQILVVIADRGQGILSSLQRVQPQLLNDQQAIELAFEKKISGRSPEKRGNGLKFVRTIINGNSLRKLVFISGSGLARFGRLETDQEKWLINWHKSGGHSGTLAFLVWKTS